MGSHLARYLALDAPDRVIAVHRTDAGLPVFAGDPASLTPEERDWLEESRRWGAAEGAYAAMQSTKPQTLAVGLMDSPAGLAAWVVEKLRSWSDCDGDLESVYTRDEVLALLTEHWVSGNVAAGIRTYRANAAIPREQLSRYVDVPSGFSVFAGDVVRPPRAWLDRVANTVYATEPARGGHFAAFEQPEAYAHELRSFFGGL
jgi:pimeloyl-ACP methyl ester carboxylesterase